MIVNKIEFIIEFPKWTRVGQTRSYACEDNVRPRGYELVQNRENPHCGIITAKTKPSFPLGSVIEARTTRFNY